MPTKSISREANLSRNVEKQMRNWEITREQQQRAGKTHKDVADFITICNIVGAGGNEVAAELGRRLGWPIFDRDLLTHMAGDDKTRTGLYRSMDERDLGWLETTLRCLLDATFRKNDYFHRLMETVLCLARQGPAVFIGRSTDLILPKSKGLRVKVIASMEYCATRFAQRNHIDLQQAREEVTRIENERRDFIQNHFHIDAYDSMRFDMLINVERFSIDQTVDLILAAHRARSES